MLCERVLGPHGDRIDQVEHVLLAVGIQREDLAVLHHRTGERIGEDLLRHQECLGFARRLLAGGVLGLQRQLDARSRPDMLGQVARRSLPPVPCASRRGRLSFISGGIVERVRVRPAECPPARIRRRLRSRRSRPRPHRRVSSAPFAARLGSSEKRITGGLSGDHRECPASKCCARRTSA